MFYKDKRSSKTKNRRIKENTLLLLSAIGGSIGAFLGMIIFKHKTKKNKFKFLLPLIIIAHFFILVLIF